MNKENQKIDLYKKFMLLLSIKTVARAINTLKEKKMINRIGSDKKGYWEIIK